MLDQLIWLCLFWQTGRVIKRRAATKSEPGSLWNWRRLPHPQHQRSSWQKCAGGNRIQAMWQTQNHKPCTMPYYESMLREMDGVIVIIYNWTYLNINHAQWTLDYPVCPFSRFEWARGMSLIDVREEIESFDTFTQPALAQPAACCAMLEQSQEEQQVRLDFICVTCLRGNDYLPELMNLDRCELDGAPRQTWEDEMGWFGLQPSDRHWIV